MKLNSPLMKDTSIGLSLFNSIYKAEKKIIKLVTEIQYYSKEFYSKELAVNYKIVLVDKKLDLLKHDEELKIQGVCFINYI